MNISNIKNYIEKTSDPSIFSNSNNNNEKSIQEISKKVNKLYIEENRNNQDDNYYLNKSIAEEGSVCLTNNSPITELFSLNNNSQFSPYSNSIISQNIILNNNAIKDDNVYWKNSDFGNLDKVKNINKDIKNDEAYYFRNKENEVIINNYEDNNNTYSDSYKSNRNNDIILDRELGDVNDECDGINEVPSLKLSRFLKDNIAEKLNHKDSESYDISNSSNFNRKNCSDTNNNGKSGIRELNEISIFENLNAIEGLCINNYNKFSKYYNENLKESSNHYLELNIKLLFSNQEEIKDLNSIKNENKNNAITKSSTKANTNNTHTQCNSSIKEISNNSISKNNKNIINNCKTNSNSITSNKTIKTLHVTFKNEFFFIKKQKFSLNFPINTHQINELIKLINIKNVNNKDYNTYANFPTNINNLVCFFHNTIRCSICLNSNNLNSRYSQYNQKSQTSSNNLKDNNLEFINKNNYNHMQKYMYSEILFNYCKKKTYDIFLLLLNYFSYTNSH